MSDEPMHPVSAPVTAKNQAEKRLFGMVIMAACGLVATLCGLCTLAFVGGASGDSSGLGSFLAILALILGGVPTAAGIGGFIIGLQLYRSGAPRDAAGVVIPLSEADRVARNRVVGGVAIVMAGLVALSIFGAQVLFSPIGFLIARWTFLDDGSGRWRLNGWCTKTTDSPPPSPRFTQNEINAGGLAVTVGLLALAIGGGGIVFEIIGAMIAFWLYRGAGRQWFGLK